MSPDAPGTSSAADAPGTSSAADAPGTSSAADAPGAPGTRGTVRDGGRSVALAAFASGVREYARTPVLLALFAFLPAYLIGAFTRLVPSSTARVVVPGDGPATLETAAVYAVLMAPLVGALVGALAGVFLLQTARESDARLVVAGARPTDLLLARFALLGVVAVAVAVVAVGTVATTYVPERPLLVGVAVVLAALVYGLLGALAGLVVDRLAGVYLALFGTMIDVFLVQNPFADPPGYAAVLPGHAPVELAVDAGFSTHVALATIGESAAYLLVVGAVTALALSRTMRVR